jgi:hypothetical protein
VFSRLHYKPDPIIVGERELRHVKNKVFRILRSKKFGVNKEDTEIMASCAKKLCSGTPKPLKGSLIKLIKMERQPKISHTKRDT